MATRKRAYKTDYRTVSNQALEAIIANASYAITSGRAVKKLAAAQAEKSRRYRMKHSDMVYSHDWQPISRG